MEKPPSLNNLDSNPIDATNENLTADYPQELFEQQVEMSRFAHEEPGSSTRSSLEKTKNYLRVMLASAVFVLGGKVIHDVASEFIEEKSSVEYVTKSGLQEKAEKAGFDLKIDVPNGDGPYILHVGYTHAYTGDTPSAETINHSAHDLIVEGNRAAEQLLLSLKEVPGSEAVVFTEGFDEQSTEFLEFLSTDKNRIKAVGNNENAVSELTDIVSNLPSLEVLPRHARIAFEYSIIKKLLELSRNNIPVSEGNLTVLMDTCDIKLGSFDPTTIEERMIKEGASLKTFMDGEYRIAPAESAVLLQDIKGAEAELAPLREKLNTLAKQSQEGSSGAIQEYQSVALQYNLSRSLLHKEKIMDARENYAIQLIKETAAQEGVQSGIVPMLYGASHDFGNNVKGINEADGKGKIGLITVIPKAFKGSRE